MKQRKTTKVTPAVKLKLEEMKRDFLYKNESQVIAYLIVAYEQFESKISISEGRYIAQIAMDLENQAILK